MKKSRNELLRHDRHFVYEIWKERDLKWKALCDDIRSDGLYNSYIMKIKKFEELLGLIMTFWGTNPKEEKKTQVARC